MHHRVSAPILTTLILACAAGATATISAPCLAYSTPRSVATGATLDFRSASWLSDRKVVNNNGEEIANVSDLILDRGTGRIEYMVIKTGTTLGLGGRAVAIPYGSFKWEGGEKDRFVLASTAEQLKLFPEYTPESWKAMKAAQGDDKNALYKRLTADAATPSDPYAGNLADAKKVHVDGVVQKVERVRTSSCGEQVVVTVEEKEGPAKRIALGPSWFVNATPAAPMRGDKIVVDALALPRDPDHLLVATDTKIDDHKLQLRDSAGHPAWALKTVQSGGTSYGATYSRYLLMSSLPGMKIDCRGNECGKVDALILDRTSGEIGFLSVDPNENFLGIGDKKRLVPWSVATVTLDGNVRIDASKEMVLATPETPSELATLNSGDQAGRVYKAFNVGVPNFDAPKVVSADKAEPKDAWAVKGPILNAIESDTTRIMTGTVLDITEVKFEGATKPARAMKIRQAGDAGGEDIVLTGPSWYMENQKPMCTSGDTIKVEVVRTTIDGKRYWLAKSIECKDTRAVMLSASNSPAWAE